VKTVAGTDDMGGSCSGDLFLEAQGAVARFYGEGFSVKGLKGVTRHYDRLYGEGLESAESVFVSDSETPDEIPRK